MVQRGTSTFSDPSAYAAAFGDARVLLTISSGGDFSARFVELRLRYSDVYRCSEALSRIAFICLPPDRISVTFPCGRTSLVSNGFSLAPREIALHGPGERIHQLGKNICEWGLISFEPDQLLSCARALTGRTLNVGNGSKRVHPSRADAMRFHHVLTQACQLAGARHDLVERPEVARALDQELLHAVINCLFSQEDAEGSRKAHRHAAIMARLEAALESRIATKLSIPDLCTEIGVPERSLRACCTDFLGIGPGKYLLLRRLNLARLALQKAHSSTSSVAEIARSLQFSELGRFAESYRSAFGELPSVTLQRSSQTSPRFAEPA